MLIDPGERGRAADDVVSIPPITYETRRWIPTNRDRYSRSELRRQTGEYRSSVTASIAEWAPQLSAETITEIEEATLALRDFDLYALSRLGADNPTLGPMSAILLRTESSSSSQIENLTASARQIALAEIEEGDRQNAKVVIGNVRAMEAALRLADSLNISSILAMHAELLAHQEGMEHEAGRLRDQLVWIGGGSAGPLRASFVAQQHERVADSLNDLERFMARDDLPALLQAAVAHAQFETIHPFVDGNGRTGRSLVHAMLRSKGITVNTTVPVSAGLLTDTEEYFRALTAFRAGDAAPIIRRFAAASRFAVSTGRHLIEELGEAVEVSRSAIAGVRSQALAWKVLPKLVAQPVINTRYIQDTFGVSAVSAIRALRTLTDSGVLRERTGFARNRVWQHDPILDRLDDYAAQVRRATVGP